ncbi:MAG: hypothetical protein KDM63_08735 [Verrucomicrobiae bacterium]|nr:hypothetical protein [Verrucomicrobiae bacterium]MCB1087118.1 hypothetical protein [Verrucomicrobiae bacterium]
MKTPQIRILAILAAASGFVLLAAKPNQAEEPKREAPEARRERPEPPEARREGERPRGEEPARREATREVAERPRPDVEAFERRIHAIREAAEILARADVQPQANMLREQAEHMQREFAEQREREAHQPPHGDQIESLQRQVAELREIVNDLRHQLRGREEGPPRRETPREGAPERR